MFDGTVGGTMSQASWRKTTGQDAEEDEEGPVPGSSGDFKGQKQISSLAREAQPKFNAFISAASAQGYTIVPTSARRVPSHQWCLKYGNCDGITPATPCQSSHQYGFALDINVDYTTSSGKQKTIMSKSPKHLWKKIEKIANDNGLKWMGMSDPVHFYDPGGNLGDRKKACKKFFTDTIGGSPQSWGDTKMKEKEQDANINAPLLRALAMDQQQMSTFAESNLADAVRDMILLEIRNKR